MNMCTREKEKFWQPAPLSHHTPSLRIHKYTFDTQVNSQNTRHSNRPQHSNQQKKNAEAKQKLEMAHWTRMFFLPSENWMVNKKKTLQQKKKRRKIALTVIPNPNWERFAVTHTKKYLTRQVSVFFCIFQFYLMWCEKCRIGICARQVFSIILIFFSLFNLFADSELCDEGEKNNNNKDANRNVTIN